MIQRILTSILSVALLCTVAVLPSTASAQTWTIDAAHSSVGFKVRHMMVSYTRGNFDKVDGTITFDGKLAKASVDITIDTASIDTDNEKRDTHLKSADFFDVEAFPAATFKSTKIKAGKDNSFEIIGNLTIKGVTKEVTLKAEGGLTPVTDPWGNTKLGFSATTTINRADYGLTWNKALETGGVVVGEEVMLEIEVELNKAKE